MFRPQVGRNDRLLSSGVQKLFEDRNGWLWIVYTNGGLSCYNPVINTFTSLVYAHNNPHSLTGNHITSYHTSRDGTVWIAFRACPTGRRHGPAGCI